MAIERLLIYSLVLFLATGIIGASPFFIRWKRSSVHKVSVISTGVLIGAALYIVIPEAASAIYEAAVQKSVEGETIDLESYTHKYGGALLLGFLMMYIVESTHGSKNRTSDMARSASYASTSASMNAYNDEEVNLQNRQSFHSRPKATTELLKNDDTHSNSFSLVLGLVVHSLADGLSLGASALASSGSSDSESAFVAKGVDMIIFLAIILHKGPTAFALGTLLMHDTTCSNGMRARAMFLFSAAAPVAAILSYVIVYIIAETGGMSDKSFLMYITGLALAFSGGTFLFVATHVTGQALGSGDSYRVQDHDSCMMTSGRSASSTDIQVPEYSTRDSFLTRCYARIKPILESDSTLVVIGILIPPFLTAITG